MRTSKKSTKKKPAAKPKAKPKPAAKATVEKKPPKITGKKIRDRRFAEEIVIAAGNATEAARKIGVRAKNAKVAGSELLAQETVQEEVKQVMEEIHKEKVLTAQQVMERISAQATFDPLPYMNDDGTINLLQLQADGKGHLIQGYDSYFNTITQSHHTKVFFYSHQKALFMMAECYGLKQAAKPNEFDAVRNGVRAYMQANHCTLEEALDRLPAKYPVVARYASRLLEEGVLPA